MELLAQRDSPPKQPTVGKVEKTRCSELPEMWVGHHDTIVVHRADIRSVAPQRAAKEGRLS
jgi:hypothetical protein